MVNPFAEVTLPMRGDLMAALGIAWAELGAAGAWLSGTERVAIVAEARAAWRCTLCKERKTALSPYGIEGAHDQLDLLPPAWVDIIHRVITDSGRLTSRWLKVALADGVAEDEFIEIVSVAVLTVTVDSFALGIGLSEPALPTLVQGMPARRRDAGATPGPGWVSTIAPENAGPEFADFYANGSHFYIRRALTLVPAETRRIWKLLNRLYLEDPRVHELDGIERAIDRAQIEFLAARASALLGCYY